MTMINHPTIQLVSPTGGPSNLSRQQADHPTDPSIVFFGNTKYSKIVERILFDKFGLTGVVTIPDKPKGRKRIISANPVKFFAKENKIPTVETEKLDSATVKKIAHFTPDFIVVCDFGLILPENLLKIPKFAPLNVHHSLLPKYRGPSPAPSAILAGEKNSGVTIFEMTKDVDAGPILAQCEYTLASNETTDSLLTKLNTLGAKLLIGLLEVRPLAEVRHLKQDERQATYTRRFAKEDGEIDIDNPPNLLKLDRMIRAFYPWPGVWSKVKVKSGESKIIKLLPDPNYLTTKPSNYPTNFLLQPEGKKPMTIKEFLNGYPKFKASIEKLI